MVFEQLLTILFAIGVGAAIIVYAAKPRQRSVPVSIPGASPVGSFGQTAMVQADPTPLAVVEAPIVAAPVAPEPESAVEVAPAVVDAVAPAPAETSTVQSIASVDVLASPAPQVESVATATSSPARPHRASRRKSTTTKTRARSSTRTRKQ